MMKKYVAEKMIKKSRHIDYFNTLNVETKNKILNRIDELVEEENKYCDKGNYGHLCNILSAIAIYEVLQETKSEAEAFEIVSNEMYKFIEPTREKFQKIATKSWFWPVMKKIIPIGFKQGSGVGWKFTWFDSKDKNEFRFETNECIYQKIFKERHLEKLGPMFCKCDIINYGELPGIDFIRTGTLCYGDEKCDFKFVKHKGEFVRSNSK